MPSCLSSCRHREIREPPKDETVPNNILYEPCRVYRVPVRLRVGGVHVKVACVDVRRSGDHVERSGESRGGRLAPAQLLQKSSTFRRTNEVHQICFECVQKVSRLPGPGHARARPGADPGLFRTWRGPGRGLARALSSRSAVPTFSAPRFRIRFDTQKIMQ